MDCVVAMLDCLVGTNGAEDDACDGVAASGNSLICVDVVVVVVVVVVVIMMDSAGEPSVGVSSACRYRPF